MSDRELPSGDPNQRYLLTGLGAAAESMALGAALADRSSEVIMAIDQGKREAALLEFGSAQPLEHDRRLARCIAGRHTNRRPYATTPPPAAALDAMRAAAAERGCDLEFITDEDARHAISHLLERATVLNFRDPAVYEEFYRWLRLDKRHPRFSIDGLTLPALEFGRLGSLGAPWALRPPVMRVLNTIRVDRILAETQASLVRHSGAIGLISRQGEGPDTFFAGGQGFTRAWLAAVEHGLSIHPVTAMLDHQETSVALRRAFGVGSASMIASFRVGFAPPTPHRSPRRPLSELSASV